jgi:KUP system potassium uptake protein
MLVLTGGEAMYADMGHFGAKPIRISWFGLVYPALLLNYLGQGAFLLGGGVRVADNLFYSTVPAAWLYPMVVLATVATVIASQALISGAFSMTAQAIALGLLPRLKVTHTHHAHAGQVYVPFINWTLFFGCALLVMIFASSSALGSAYGLAVSGDMTITSVAMLFVACRYWQWNIGKSAAVFGIFAIIDSSFLIANTLKFWEGGFIPISIGFFVFVTIVTWQWGRTLTHAGYFAHHNMALSDLIERHRQAKVFIERSAILMIPELADADQERTPTLMQMLWNRTGILPRNIIFAQVLQLKVPYIHDNRYSVTTLERSERGSVVRVQVNFGFMEEPAIERVLHEMVSHKEIELPADRRKWIIYVAVENLIASKTMRLARRIQLQAFIVLRNVSRPAYHHFGLGDKVPLSAEIFPITVR